jgi:Na+-driven multidrug efflux pump
VPLTMIHQASPQFGYGLLWTVFLTTPFMIAIQLVSAQIGRVTGRGLAANVMELAPRWIVLALISLLVAANTFNIAADIARWAKLFRWSSAALIMNTLSSSHRHPHCFKCLSGTGGTHRSLNY